jgi:hypothetical protein
LTPSSSYCSSSEEFGTQLSVQAMPTADGFFKRSRPPKSAPQVKLF